MLCVSVSLSDYEHVFNMFQLVCATVAMLPSSHSLSLSLFLYLCFGAFVLCLREWKLGHFEMEF